MSIEFTKEGHIAKVGLNIPETKNAVTTDLMVGMCDAWDECQRDEAIRAVVVYSVLPDIFCAGFDIDDSIPLLTGRRPLRSDKEKFLYSEADGLRGYNKAVLRVRDLIKPVIVAINGWCLTIGFELSMGANLRIATEDAKFQIRETRLGIMPCGGANIFLPEIIGSTPRHGSASNRRRLPCKQDAGVGLPE